MLLLKKHLVDLVRAGKKRQTIRFWTRPIVFPGQISFTPGLGKMKILRVEELAGYESLTPGDARDDGFDTLEELLAELKRNYPQVPAGKRLYRVVFQWPLDLPAPEVLPENASTQRQFATNPAIKLVSNPPIRTRIKQGNKAAMKQSADGLSEQRCNNAMSKPQRELLRNWIVAHYPGHG